MFVEIGIGLIMVLGVIGICCGAGEQEGYCERCNMLYNYSAAKIMIACTRCGGFIRIW